MKSQTPQADAVDTELADLPDLEMNAEPAPSNQVVTGPAPMPAWFKLAGGVVVLAFILVCYAMFSSDTPSSPVSNENSEKGVEDLVVYKTIPPTGDPTSYLSHATAQTSHQILSDATVPPKAQNPSELEQMQSMLTAIQSDLATIKSAQQVKTDLQSERDAAYDALNTRYMQLQQTLEQQAVAVDVLTEKVQSLVELEKNKPVPSPAKPNPVKRVYKAPVRPAESLSANIVAIDDWNEQFYVIIAVPGGGPFVYLKNGDTYKGWTLQSADVVNKKAIFVKDKQKVSINAQG